jgi:hypothetical protein
MIELIRKQTDTCLNKVNLWQQCKLPIRVAARYMVWHTFALSHTCGLWVRIPLQTWISSVYTMFVLCCACSSLETGWSPVQGVLSTVYNIVTCYLGSQPIQRFVAGQQLRNTQQALEKLLGSRTRVTMEIQLEGVFYVVSPKAISRELPVVRYSCVTVQFQFFSVQFPGVD